MRLTPTAPDPPPLRRLHAAVALLSVAVIAFQLVLMQLLSIVQWHHFAYMVISVALLGFGASGTVLALARTWLLARFARVLPALMLGCGAAMAAVVPLSRTALARFDAYLLFAEAGQAGALLGTYLLFFVPFFLAALVIGLVFVARTEHVGTYYFANLVGSGVGGLVALGLLAGLAPERLPAATALLPVGAALLVLPRHRRGMWIAAALLVIAGAGVALVRPPALPLSQYKALRTTLQLPEARIVRTEHSPYGLVQVVEAPSLRYAPGLSLTYTDPVPVQQAVFNNAMWYGPVPAWSRQDTTHLLDHTTAALPYVLQDRDTVLVLGAGTGDAVAHALTRDANSVVAVEPHGAVLDLLRGPLAAATDSLLYHEAVALRRLEPRTYLAASAARYDLIVLPTLGAFGGTGGLLALQEQYALTREAVREMWTRLAPGGAVGLTVWLDYPYRNVLKALATFVEVLTAEGVADPAAHLAAVRSWGAVTLVLTRTPVSAVAAARLRQFCDREAFDPLLLPGLRPAERMQHHHLPDDQLFELVDQILTPARTALYDAYPFAIRPATDDRPYFAQFLQWRSLPRLAEQFGRRTVPFLEVGYLVVLVTLVQIALAALVLIVLPLVRLGWRGPGKGTVLLYFGGLGLGYLFVEMIFIQRFTLYLGHPLYAAAAVLTILLIASGMGSWLSERVAPRPRRLSQAAGLVALLVVCYAVGLTPVLQATIGWPLAVKALATLVLIAPPAFAMGWPFPLGLRWLGQRHEDQVPWAWGINGCLSVVAAPLATLLAVELGFPVVMGLAAGAYGVVALLMGWLGRSTAQRG